MAKSFGAYGVDTVDEGLHLGFKLLHVVAYDGDVAHFPSRSSLTLAVQV